MRPRKRPRGKRKAVKNDPKLVAAARELRDRWLEHVNGDGAAKLTANPFDCAQGRQKYDVSRPIPMSAPSTSHVLFPAERKALPIAA
jgi:hypothetical protein